MNRRELLKNSAIGIAGVSSVFAVSCSKKEEAKTEEPAKEAAAEAKTEVNYVSETDNVAQSLGYKEDANSVDPATRADKGETKGSEQFCTNCRFYTAEEGSEGGKCTLFPGKYVKGQAWCKSWSLKQQA